MRPKWFFFLKMSVHLVFEVFLAKNQKKFKNREVEKYVEETDSFEKNAFIRLKNIFSNV